MRPWTLLATLFLAVVGTAAQAAPPPVTIEDLTSPELRAAVAAGATTVLVPTGGTEQNGAHMVLGKHNRIVAETARRIAAALGDTLVAPVLPLAPEGAVTPPTGNMAFPGTLTLPEPVFAAVLEWQARSLKAAGFTTICFVGDHGGSQGPQARVAAALSAEWASDRVAVVNVGDYYDDRRNGQTAWLTAQGETAATIGTHAGLADTAELLAIDPGGVRADRLGPGVAAGSGGDGDPSRASPQRGARLIQLKVDAAVAQIRKSQRRN